MDLKVLLVHSCIHSRIDNFNSTYFALSQSHKRKLQRIQNAAVKYIFSLKGKERFQYMRHYLKNLHFLPVVQRIQFKVALLVFKCINNMAPTYLIKLITMRQIRGKLNFQRKNKLYFAFHCTQYLITNNIKIDQCPYC